MAYKYEVPDSFLQNIFWENQYIREKKEKVKALKAERDKLDVKIGQLNTEIYIHTNNIICNAGYIKEVKETKTNAQ